MWIYLDDKRKDQTISHNDQRGMGIDIARSNKWIVVRNYNDFCSIVSSNLESIDLISFDHDISSYDENEKEMTGKDAAQFLIDLCMERSYQLPDWFVHSDNNRGNENIRLLLINYMYRIEKRIDSMNRSFGFFRGKFINNR